MQEITESEKKQRNENREKYIREFQRKHFGNRFEGASLAQSNIGFREPEQKQILEWIRKGSDFLVLIGPPGTGKTHMCSALAGVALKRFNTIRVWREEGIFAYLRRAIESYGDYYNTLKDCLDDEFCIVDDIGSTPVNDWRKEIIFNIVDIRSSMGLPTVFTSNYDRATLTEKYESRVTSRLFSASNTVIDLFGMPDLRAAGF